MDAQLVRFDCETLAWLPQDEFGDGSGWCQFCGKFECYRDLEISERDVEEAARSMRSWDRRSKVVASLVSAREDDHGYAEHLREAREVEAHQEAKHGDA